MQARAQIEIRKASENEYYFVIKLTSGGIFMSKFFEDLEEALSAAEKIKRSATEENCYLIKTDNTGQPYFIFNIKNNSPVGQSSIYKSWPAMDSGIHFMKKHLAEAEIVDLTT